MTTPKYFVQILERTKHFSIFVNLITKDKLSDWVEEAQAIIRIHELRNPENKYSMYVSNNPVDLAKGEKRLLITEATKLLKGESRKIGIFKSTKLYYLGMSRDITTFDFDLTSSSFSIPIMRYNILGLCIKCNLTGSFTKTPHGIHIHLPSEQKESFLTSVFSTQLMSTHLDKVGHDVCSPIIGTYKDGYLITGGIFDKGEITCNQNSIL